MLRRHQRHMAGGRAAEAADACDLAQFPRRWDFRHRSGHVAQIERTRPMPLERELMHVVTQPKFWSYSSTRSVHLQHNVSRSPSRTTDATRTSARSEF